MKTYLTVLNSDAINRYDFSFAVSALESGMWQRATSGVPTHLGHDMHKPVGWMFPHGLYFQPGLVRAIGQHLIPETQDEQTDLYTARRNYLYRAISEDAKEYEAGFYPLIKDHVSENHTYINVAAFSVLDKDVVERVFPNLIALKDKDDLIPISALLEDFNYKAQGVFFHKTLPLCIYAHPYFRKSLSRFNNFHFFFIDELMSHITNKDVTLKIALDWDLIGYTPSFSEVFELEYWFGPKYGDDISGISPGLTKHGSTEAERLYYGISATEFYWKIDDNHHEFEMEELKEDEVPVMTDTYACRYIHSIYDDDKKTFIHFDGAIRSYNTELYFERIDKKMTEFGRRSDYKKLFRVDGALDLKDWKSLSTNYMQGNPLIYEYFGLEKPETISYVLNEQPKTIKQQLVPYSIDPGDSIRMMVSYHPRNTTHTDSHVVSIYDIIETETATYHTLEYDIIEVKKALGRLGKNLTIPDALLCYAEDMYWNIPCIFHGAEDPQSDLDTTLTALSNIISRLCLKKKSRVISFTLAWNMEDKEVRVSVIGDVKDLQEWLKQSPMIPITHEEFIKWLEMQKTYLNAKNVLNPNLPMLEELSQFDGVLYIKRRIVDSKYNLEFSADDTGIKYEMVVPVSEVELLEAYDKKEIVPVMSCVARKLLCSKTNDDYWNSPYSKILDDGVYTIIQKIEIMDGYWTDKPAHNV